MAIIRRNSKSTAQAQSAPSQRMTPAQLLAYGREHGLSLPLDTTELTRLLRIGFRQYPMEMEKSGFLKREEGRWIIGINSLHHPKRQAFTWAHELGHYFLHRDSIVDEIEDRTLFRANGFGESGMEAEANKFAALLLMPELEFKESVARNNGDIEKISLDFGVSSLAVSIRAQNLGYQTR